MAIIVQMPRLSDTMTEGTLAQWRKAIGDSVSAGEAFAEIETDKAVMTFESFDDGVLLATLVEEGDTVPLGTPIAVLGDAGEDVSGLLPELQSTVAAALAGESTESQADEEPAPQDEEVAEDHTPAAMTAPEPEPDDATLSVSEEGDPHARRAPTGDDGIRVKASPLARRLAARRGIDLTLVLGSGPRGRIVAQDLEGVDPTRRIESLAARGLGSSAPARDDEVLRVTQMRKTIATRLVEAKQSAPHYYLQTTIDGGALREFRQQFNAAQDTVRISYNDLVMRACALTLQAHPKVNAAWEGKSIRQFGSVHLGFAVAIDEGLITPVIRHAERLDIASIATQVRAMAERARSGTLESSEYTGNSFCVSNLGMFGVERFTAIINPPAACILAVGALRKEPVVKDDAITIGYRMTLTLSCDHRVVDGATGAAFLADLKAALEAPLKLVL